MIKFAHRGASGYAPENTLGSIKKAVMMGAKAFEIDVQLTRDNEVVVYHDYSLGRVFAGEGNIKDNYLKELRFLPIKNNFSEEFSSEVFPVLKEVLEIIPKESILNIELKAIDSEKREIEDYILKSIESFPKENILFSSFNHEILKRIAEKDKELKIGLLFEELPDNLEEYINESKIKPYSINPSAKFLTEEKVKDIKKLGYKTFVYTVNDVESFEKLKKYEVDGIFTDYLDRF